MGCSASIPAAAAASIPSAASITAATSTFTATAASVPATAAPKAVLLPGNNSLAPAAAAQLQQPTAKALAKLPSPAGKGAGQQTGTAAAGNRQNQVIPTKAAAATDPVFEVARTMKELFQDADSDDNGYLSLEELQGLLERPEIKLDPQQIQQIFESSDRDMDGQLSYAEFLPVMMNIIMPKGRAQATGKPQAQSDANYNHQQAAGPVFELARTMKGLFQEADSDDNGYLSLSELQALLERPEIKLDPPQIQQIFESSDRDMDGQLSYAEFLPVMMNIIMPKGRALAVGAA